MPDDTVASCGNTNEPIEMPFGLWTRVAPRNHVLVRWRTYWRNLANTTESSMCSGNAACCPITLTTCLRYLVFMSRHMSGRPTNSSPQRLMNTVSLYKPESLLSQVNNIKTSHTCQVLIICGQLLQPHTQHSHLRRTKLMQN